MCVPRNTYSFTCKKMNLNLKVSVGSPTPDPNIKL